MCSLCSLLKMDPQNVRFVRFVRLSGLSPVVAFFDNATCTSSGEPDKGFANADALLRGELLESSLECLLAGPRLDRSKRFRADMRRLRHCSIVTALTPDGMRFENGGSVPWSITVSRSASSAMRAAGGSFGFGTLCFAPGDSMPTTNGAVVALPSSSTLRVTLSSRK